MIVGDKEATVTTQEQVQMQDAWDNIAAGYDRTTLPRRCGWRTKASAAPISVRVCGFWTLRLAAVP
jgi:hypothetical protein